MYWMSPGIDLSAKPPRDPFVATLPNGQEAPACLVSQLLGAVCGASQTNDGVSFDNSRYLDHDECAECVKSSKLRKCEDGFEKAYTGLALNYCCRRHQCALKSYRASEAPELLRKIGRPEHAAMMEYALSQGTTSDPGVPVHCIISYNIQTFNNLSVFVYPRGAQANVTLDDGDGTVDFESLNVCTRWPSTVKTYRVEGVKHGGMLDVAQLVDILEAVAVGDDAKWKDWKEPRMSELICHSKHSLANQSQLLIARNGSAVDGLVAFPKEALVNLVV